MPIEEKDLYDQINANYRYFLDWRAKLLAGHFAVLFSLGVAFAWLLDKTQSSLQTLFLCAIPFVAFILTLLFWALETRNRRQYRDCMRAGRQLEQPAATRPNPKKLGVFSNMDTTDKFDDGEYRSSFSHSLILNIWFGGVALLFMLAGVALCCARNSLLK